METTLHYTFAFRVREPRNFYSPYHNRERVIGELCIDLLDKYGYPGGSVQIGESIAVRTPQGMTFMPIDILVKNQDGSPLLIIEAAAQDGYTAGYETAIQKLFTLAKTLHTNAAAPLFLIYHTHWHKNGKLEGKHAIIDYRAYPDFVTWRAKGRPRQPDFPKNGQNPS